ncbi:MAG: valine--tRNA ligase [Oligoflexales bacterium]|nr:valine--tRNA ligase [Oligoflexales bacterium]
MKLLILSWKLFPNSRGYISGEPAAFFLLKFLLGPLLAKYGAIEKMSVRINSHYDHKTSESKWWKFWMEGSFFEAQNESQKESFCILIPPPNVTDRLHMGHGLNNTIQDILIRWKRMQGYNCLWLPGTDHAGISTQMMVEKSLAKEGLSRKSLGRERFFKLCEEWKEKNGGIIVDQLKRLGSSCDWSRLTYTMDPQMSAAVRAIFVKLFEEGLVYRGEKMVHWDVQLETALSDDEVVNQEMDGSLCYYRYPLIELKSDGTAELTGEFLPVATTRPETLFGDRALVVNPEDERYQQWIGKLVKVPFVDRYIPVLADPQVRMDFGTGCVKVTPAHDPKDFELGKRHGLALLNVMEPDGKLNSVCPAPFCGMDRVQARQSIIHGLKDLGLFDKNQAYRHSVPISDRTKSIIEPRISKQWFVRMQPLAQPALGYARSGELRFFPDSWKKTYYHWLENVQDWCISRQLWWGHRIPIWFCRSCEGVTTGLEDPSKCSHCQSVDIFQDEDVLDTWFSSWLWPLGPLGWPQDTQDLQTFFPTQVLVTGADIIYLWVARMIMVSHFAKGKLPFRDVYFNTIICDKDGKKFSKTLGNGIDPLSVIDKHGADVARFTTVSLAPLGGRARMDLKDFDNGTRFVNKIWNAARFLLDKVDEQGMVVHGEIPAFDLDSLPLSSRGLIFEFKSLTKAVTNSLNSYQFQEACELLYHFVWHNFCDWGIEAAKEDFSQLSSLPELAKSSLSVLVYVFEGTLRLLAPFMPFVCEELWHEMPKHALLKRPQSLVVADYPYFEKNLDFVDEAAQWTYIKEIVSAVRSLRMQAKVQMKERVDVYVLCDAAYSSLLQSNQGLIKRLAGVKDLYSGSSVERPSQSLVSAGKNWAVYVPVGDFLDIEQETKRLEQEIARVAKVLAQLDKKLSDESFVSRAPADVVHQNREQQANMKAQHKLLKETLISLQC